MNTVCEEIFKAIHEGKWLKIEYQNQAQKITKYWIGIKDINPVKKTMTVEGLHLRNHSIETLNIFIDSIKNAVIVEGTYYPVNQNLIENISTNSDSYRCLFDSVVNLKILNYLEMCYKMDTVPYRSDFELVQLLDTDSLRKGVYELSDEQFSAIVKAFSNKADKANGKRSGKTYLNQLAMNVLSIHKKEGLYVLAYRMLKLDVMERRLISDNSITICTEFVIDGSKKESIRKYLDAEDYVLLQDFEKNQEQIKDLITKRYPSKATVDDIPYIMGIAREFYVNLGLEYQAITKMYDAGDVTYPIKAFFGDALEKPKRYKSYPIALVNRNINLDQLLAINKAMQYPLAYIQGPPGSGKTNTIINTIVTAFFNERTVLFTSYNNHPIDAVYDKLCSMQYHGKKIPFPILRLGNTGKKGEALTYIAELMKSVADITVYEGTLDKRKDSRKERAKQLTEILKRYEEYLELLERKEALSRLMEYELTDKQSLSLFPFTTDLQGRQMPLLNQAIEKRQGISEEDALRLIDQNEEEFMQYLYYTSAKYIKKLEGERYRTLRDIIFKTSVEEQVSEFTNYLRSSENIKALQQVFPIISTTCISACGLGEPKPLFDMGIIDEASQCNTAMSLVPIIRCENLMLVGDPQQLNPVIVLDEITNRQLREQYHITDEYDYKKNSIYKTYLASDSVSDEILLHNHYRCDPRIIGFNNKKYYNEKLKICTKSKEENPLIFVDVHSERPLDKNTSPAEVQRIVEYAKANKDKNIGIITPFVNQKELINQTLQQENLKNITCGTVHSFQGDEKEVILLSTAVGEGTKDQTYKWLKDNKELINVATSRAKEQLIVLGDSKNIERLHNDGEEDDFFELIDYVRTEGKSIVTPKETNSRALGVKPFSTRTEEAFLQNLTHALQNIWLSQSKYVVRKEVAISQVFQNNTSYDSLFYTGRFDFVVYEKIGSEEIPILAIELDGKEHLENEVSIARDRQKNQICESHGFWLIRVENSYARRYIYIKGILKNFFETKH